MSPDLSHIEGPSAEPTLAASTSVDSSVPSPLGNGSGAGRPVRTLELLAPAGDWDCLKAAAAGGADAVYFGLTDGFNARARAHNFSRADLPRIADYLHRRGMKGYVTLNTLVFVDELAEAENVVRDIAMAGLDAVIVQDVGLARLIRAVCPDLPIHASTQMTVTSAEVLAELLDLGVERVITARELSVDEIAALVAATPIPVEVFVHGALCVAYSGQCMTSESLGGRSANRGQCAQACRLPYDLIVDGQDRPLGEAKYLLSPQDLAGYALVPELLAAGVVSLKIEGRLKSPEYVVNIARHYRRAIDAALAGTRADFADADVEAMELSFSRGFSPGWLEGNDHKRLVPADRSAKRGVALGTVAPRPTGRNRRGGIAVRLDRTVRRGDGVAFDAGADKAHEQGGRVYEIFLGGRPVEAADAGTLVELTFATGAIDWAHIDVGQRVWKTDDPRLTSSLKKAIETDTPGRPVPIDVHVTAAVGEPLRLTVTRDGGEPLTLETPDPLAAAVKHPLDAPTLTKQLGRLGGTPLTLRTLTAEIAETDGVRPMVPLSVLGTLRARMIDRLLASLIERPTRTIGPPGTLDRLRQASASQTPVFPAPVDRISSVETGPALHVLVRSLEQLDAVLESIARESTVPVASVICDFPDIRGYRTAVERVRGVGTMPVWLATPRIQKPGEMGLFRAIDKAGGDGILGRNLSGLRFFRDRGRAVVADFSLNLTNDLTRDWLAKYAPTRMTASYDCNRDQLLDLVATVPTDDLEIVIHQHMPMFHMEHCVFCAVISPGTNKTNCGRPCDRHQVQLRDRVGKEHTLHADVGCRNTLYNATPQSGAEAVPALLDRGVRHFRVEFLLDEPPSRMGRTVRLYSDLLAGRIGGAEVWKQLQAANRVGVTRGTLEERRDPLQIL